MRWRFGEDGGVDASDRGRALGAIDAWWTAFAESSGRIEEALTGSVPRDFLPSFINEHLGAVDDRLLWEVGPGVKGASQRLVITVEGNYHLQPLADEIVRRAPALPAWEFYAGRLREPPETAMQLVRARLGLDSTAVGARFSAGAHNLVDIDVATSDRDPPSTAFILTELLLGESLFRDWIGTVTTRRTSGLVGRLRRGSEAVPLDEVATVFEDVRREIASGLPRLPFHERLEQGEWAVISLQPTPASDYASREDLLVGITTNVDLFAAMHQGPRFASERYSRCDETFCYLRVDRPAGTEGGEAEYRGRLEDEVGRALAGTGLGAVIGGGSGLRYTYVDLAVTDLERGLPVVVDAARRLDVPRRSWIEFFDACWRDEWVGVYDESPVPPARG